MEWLRAKARGAAAAAPPAPERPGSADRDLAGVALEGMTYEATPAGGTDKSDEVQAWKMSPDQAAGAPQPQFFGADGEDDDIAPSSPDPGAVHEISREELASRLFDSIDRSGDGTISKDELTPALQAIGFKREKAEEVFDSIDEDGSNEITKNEFMAFFLSGNNQELFRKLRYAGIKTKIPKHVPVIKTGCAGPARASTSALALQEIWDQYDEDRDGWLTEDQLYRALRSVGIRLRKKEKHELRRELEDELELWSDSNDSPTPSNASVASDADAEETVYEDHTNIVRVLQNNPSNSIERLVVNDKGKPEWTAVLEGLDRLDRDKPEQIANWVAATCTPGLSLKETEDEIIHRTNFFQTIHNLQAAHESNSLATDRLRFQRAWMDRSLEKSEAELAFRKKLKAMRTVAYWRDFFTNTILRIRKKVGEELELTQEILSRGKKSLKKSSVDIKPRPVLERVHQMFIDELGELTEYGREAKYVAAYEDVCAREEVQQLGVRGVVRAMRNFGASLNSAEVFEMLEELTGMESIVEDVSIDVDNFCALSENLFNDVLVAGGKDKVVVFIQEASDLPVMDRFGSADPFVTIEVIGRPDEDRRRSATRKNSLNPAWSHTMSIFDINPDDVLLVSLWDDEDSGFGATLIGEFTVRLGDIAESGEKVNNTTESIERWFELMDDNGNIIIGKYGGATKIRARVSYVRGSLTELKQRPSGPQNMEFSLITIKIKSAVHLPKMDKGDNGSVDAYCVISYTDHRLRTCTCLQNYNPVWEEEYVLSVDVPEGEIIVTMFDYDEEGKDDAIGSCKVFVSLLDGKPQVQAYDLRTVEENHLIVGKDGERANLLIEASLVTNEEMRTNKSLLEIMFEGMASDHHDTVLACCSAMWQVLQDDEDRCEREALHILNRWQTMADVLLTGVLEFNVYGATDLPRMDYFGLCDPYVTVSVDGFQVKTQVKKTTLDPVWDETLRVPTWLPPVKSSAPVADKPMIWVRIYDWDKVGEHDLVGSVLIPLEDWIMRGPEKTEWDIVGEPEKVRSLRPGEPDHIVRKPVIGHSGRPAKLQMTVDYKRRVVVMDECMEEICWGIAFSTIAHKENAEDFGLTLGGIGGLTSLLRKPMVEGTTGEALQAACYALGNLAASHRPNQDIIMENQGIDRLLGLCTKSMPAGVLRAACLALAAIVGDNPACIARMMNYHKKDPEEDELVQTAGGIGTLLVLLRDVRPDLNFKPKKDGPQDGWGVIAEVYEAIIKAISAASFVNTKGLWFTNATSLFSKADQRATVRAVAVAMGRPGLLIIRDLQLLPVDNKENAEAGVRRTTKEALRYANLSYQALDAAYGAG